MKKRKNKKQNIIFKIISILLIISALVASGFIIYFELYATSVVAKIKNALKEKGIKVGCITNKVEPIAKNIIKKMGE